MCTEKKGVTYNGNGDSEHERVKHFWDIEALGLTTLEVARTLTNMSQQQDLGEAK